MAHLDSEADVIVIGGGIAGASAAHAIAASASVIVLERESQGGYHSTGRSAASFTENYATPLIRRLAIGSRAFLESPPAGFAQHPLLSPRGIITIARTDQLERLAQDYDIARSFVASIVRLDTAGVIARVPVLRPDYVAGAFIEPESRDIDVNGLHQGFLRGAKARGARLVTQAEVLAIARRGDGWRVTTAAGSFVASHIVNAAGAWADAVAIMAGIAPVGLVPKRRTAFNVPVPAGMDARSWPMVDDVAAEFYFKPDAGQLFVSPADATPSPAVDAIPEDLDVAIGVERLEQATTLRVTRVSRAWAGLRTFAPDDAPLVGPDHEPGFHWFAGLGGFGIKTSPALSRVCDALLRGAPLPGDLVQLGITAAELSPARLR